MGERGDPSGTGGATRGGSREGRNRLAVAAIGAAGIVLAALISAGVVCGGRSHDPSGSIELPHQGAEVGRAFTVDGTLSHVPDGEHVWVAVQTGNLLYPKEPEIPAGDSHFSQEVVEAGSPRGGTFSVVLFLVGADGERAIKAWLAALRRGEEPPAMTSIPGGAKLDAVQSLHLRQAPIQSP